jgi:hypothetical protein
MLPLIAFCAGIYLGLRCTILALLPISFFGAGALIASSLAAGQSYAAAAITMALPFLMLQAGYMLGLSARPVYGQVLARLSVRQSRRA